MSIAVRSRRIGGETVANVRVDQRGTITEHVVRVTDDDLIRYDTADAEDLIRRSIEFLLTREPNTSILRDFDVRDIERYHSDYRSKIAR